MGVVGVGQITLFDQNETPIASLSNYAHPVPCAADGSSPNLTGAVSTFQILLAGVDITNLYSVTATPLSGITGTLSTYTYTVTTMTIDAGYVDFSATRAGFATLTKRFSLSKMKQGATGLSVWYAYHDNSPSAAPSSPTGDGTSGGWHAAITSASIWVSIKQAVNRADAGTWSTPAVISAISLTPTYAPKYLGPGKLSAVGTAAFRHDSISVLGVVTQGTNATPNPGDWMYNYDISAVATLSLFRWSATAWETTTITFEHWIAATEDILRYIKGAADATGRAARTPAAWTLLESLIANEAFIDKLALRLLRSANYAAGVAGMSIDLNNATMQAENQNWRLQGDGLAIFRDIRLYGVDYEEIDCGEYTASLPDYPYGDGEELDCDDYDGTFIPDRLIECGYVMGDD